MMNIIKIEKPIWSGEIKTILSPYSVSFGLVGIPDNAELNHEWWAYINDEGNTLGLGWIDFDENFDGQTEGEISLCVHPDGSGKSIGSNLLLFLEEEIKKRGTIITSVVVKKVNPNHSNVVSWFKKRQYNIESENDNNTYMTKQNKNL